MLLLLNKIIPKFELMIFASGTMALHDKLEKCVANFIGKPATIVFGMGYVTNSAILPVLMGKVCFFGE